MPLHLSIVIASTRPGRVGPAVARWFCGLARAESGFETELIDLAEIALPLYDEPHHPRLRRYEHAHTRRWSSRVAAADAFVFVTPEYNHGPTPALINALDFVYHEWSYKPAAFVSYGGISGGIRAVERTKLTLTTLKMVPILEAVTVPMIASHLDGGEFRAAEVHETSAKALLAELHRWAAALKPMREAPARHGNDPAPGTG